GEFSRAQKLAPVVAAGPAGNGNGSEYRRAFRKQGAAYVGDAAVIVGQGPVSDEGLEAANGFLRLGDICRAVRLPQRAYGLTLRKTTAQRYQGKILRDAVQEIVHDDAVLALANGVTLLAEGAVFFADFKYFDAFFEGKLGALVFVIIRFSVYLFFDEEIV